MQTDVAIVGAGPIGLELACELKRRGMDYVQIDKGQVASTISWFPQQTTFFSSNDRTGIAGVPLQTPGQRKATKEEYLAYLRSVVLAFGLEVRTYEEVDSFERRGDEFLLRTSRGEIAARRVVLATGDLARPRRLEIAGEDLPHVSHTFDDPHPYFRKRLLIVGGKNSAVEAALRCWHAGARVTLSYRREEVEADFVLLLTGCLADMRLFEQAGVAPEGEAKRPAFDACTMETNVAGRYVAGTASAGTQRSYSVFIENCHIHALRIAAALAGEPPPPDLPPLGPPES